MNFRYGLCMTNKNGYDPIAEAIKLPHTDSLSLEEVEKSNTVNMHLKIYSAYLRFDEDINNRLLKKQTYE